MGKQEIEGSQILKYSSEHFIFEHFFLLKALKNKYINQKG